MAKPDFTQQLEKIAEITAIAKEVNDYTAAHNPQILRAIDIVEKFLKETKRICYGGQALNAHLPDSVKFYDPSKTIPDYDFFTPDQDGDLVKLIRLLKNAGFQEIDVRLGIHEGTIKVYVNYTAVADLTEIDPTLYNLFFNRRFTDKDISYLDADSLRMLIYLELSRPRGEVERWPKVYERLLLLDTFVPIGSKRTRSSKLPKLPKNYLTKDEYKFIFKYIVQNRLLFAGADLKNLYEKLLKTAKHIKITHRHPITFFVKNLKQETVLLENILYDFSLLEKRYRAEASPLSQSQSQPSSQSPFQPPSQTKSKIQISSTIYDSINGDMIPPMSIIYKGTFPVILLIQETACHSYYNWPLETGEVLRVASVDTLATLFFALGLRGEGSKEIINFLGGFERLAREIVKIAQKSRSSKTKFPFPFLTLDCEGYQQSYKSLIKEKVMRMRRKTVRKRLNEIKKKILSSKTLKTRPSHT
jgi:hypothetical protein